MVDEYGRVPAGWYPDPLGLPQLRWWDNHSWTEHVSDARQPMMPTQPAAATMFADDDEATTRRGRRSAESAGTVDDDGSEQLTASVLRQLAGPGLDTPPLVESVMSASVRSAAAPSSAVPSAAAPSAPAASAPSAADAFAAAAFAGFATDSANSTGPANTWIPVDRTSSAPQGYGATPGYSSAPAQSSAPAYSSAPTYDSAPGAPAYAPGFTDSPVSASDPRGRVDRAPIGATPHLQTVQVWAIALLPMLQLVLSLLVVSAFSTGPSVPIMAAIWLAPYPVVILLALLDARSLRRQGIDHPESGWWALAGAPVYLITRAVRLSRISGAGFGPVSVWLLLVGLQLASILAVPGLVIAALPMVFADQASQSIESGAQSIGVSLDATCPITPPLFIGQQLRCPATNANGENVVVTVSLQRLNGWVTWQVDDWGVFSMVR